MVVMVDIDSTYYEAKPVSFSSEEDVVLSFSEKDISPHEVFFGGVLLQSVEKIVRQVVQTHTPHPLLNKGIDFVRFYSSIKKEDKLLCYVAINKTWKYSLEVGVKVIAEDFRLLERKKVLSAYFTFSMAEEYRKDGPIVAIIIQNKEEKRRYKAAEKRRILRYGLFSNI